MIIRAPHIARQTERPTPMSQTVNTSAHRDMLMITLLMGGAFCAMHLFNSWALRSIEFSEHISLIYLPGFLRLVHVLVLGMFWGTAATAVGGLLLLFWSNDPLLVSLANIGVSASVAMVSVLLMQLLRDRRLALTRLDDLVQLALLYAVLNAALHHLVWSWLDPSQLVQPIQLFYMALGDVNGAIVGALVLRWVAQRTGLKRLLRERSQRADESDSG